MEITFGASTRYLQQIYCDTWQKEVVVYYLSFLLEFLIFKALFVLSCGLVPK
jgi:hypothetical protein